MIHMNMDIQEIYTLQGGYNMDNDFYIEETSPVKRFLGVLFALLFLAALGSVYYFYFYHEEVKLKTVIIELGDTLPQDVNYYIKNKKEYDYKIDLSKVSVDDEGSVNSTGEYSYTITVKDEIFKGKILVKDTTPPVVLVKDLKIGVDEEFDFEDFIESCTDLSIICSVNFADEKYEKYVSTPGEYDVKLEVKDKYNNKTVVPARLIVSENYSLKEEKANDQEVSNIYPIDDAWNKTYTIKFEKGLSEEDHDFEKEILELSNFDFNQIFEDKIVNQTILTIYNKYKLALGFSVKLEFEDGKIVYVTQREFNSL